MPDKPTTEELAERLLAACNGHPNAKIPWPHRLLHETAARLRALEAENKRLREGLAPFLVGGETMEKVLWGDMPDSATGSVTVKLGDFRRARAALKGA